MVAELDIETRRVLWACYEYWATEPLPVDERVICFKWVKRRFESRFGTKLTRREFDRAAKSGLLAKADTSRGGDRRYYRLVDPEQLRQVGSTFSTN